VREVEERIGESTEPYRAAVELLDTIPGVNPTAAHVILGEIGLDMTRCPTASHLISRAGFVRATTRAPASGARLGSARAPFGS